MSRFESITRKLRHLIVRGAVVEPVKPIEEIPEPSDSALHRRRRYAMTAWPTLRKYNDQFVEQYPESIEKSYYQSPLVYKNSQDVPRIAFIKDPVLVKSVHDEDGRGLAAIENWMRLYEFDLRYQTPFWDMIRDADMIYRRHGEVFLEYRFLTSLVLMQMGFPLAKMLRKIHVVSPLQIPPYLGDNPKRDENGVITELKIVTDSGEEITVVYPETLRFVHLKNEPETNTRGTSPITPALWWIGSFDDGMDMVNEVLEQIARPITQWILNREGITPEQWTERKAELESDINNVIMRQLRAFVTDDQTKLNVEGYNGKYIDVGPHLSRLKERTYDALGQIPGFVTGEGLNRGIMERLIDNFYMLIRVHDWKFAVTATKRFIFPEVLASMGLPTNIAPDIKFLPLPSTDRFKDALADQVESDVFGEPRRSQIAIEKGYELGIRLQVEDKRGTAQVTDLATKVATQSVFGSDEDG